MLKDVLYIIIVLGGLTLPYLLMREDPAIRLRRKFEDTFTSAVRRLPVIASWRDEVCISLYLWHIINRIFYIRTSQQTLKDTLEKAGVDFPEPQEEILYASPVLNMLANFASQEIRQETALAPFTIIEAAWYSMQQYCTTHDGAHKLAHIAAECNNSGNEEWLKAILKWLNEICTDGTIDKIISLSVKMHGTQLPPRNRKPTSQEQQALEAAKRKLHDKRAARVSVMKRTLAVHPAGIACAALLIGGIWCVEGDYQTFMRISVCLWGIVTAYKLQRAKATPWATLAAIGIAILYNPIHPIHFDEDWAHSFDSDTWLPVNIAAAISSIILTRLAWGAADKR